ncbi:MAG: DUF4345 domain-containing protein [Pseudomonadota bacterium]
MISKIFLILNALIIFSIGCAYLYDPNLLLANYGEQLSSVALDNLLRATYGGLFIASAAFMALGAWREPRLRDALMFTALFMAAQAVGRMVSFAAAGAPPEAMAPLLYFEVAVAAIGLALWAGRGVARSA